MNKTLTAVAAVVTAVPFVATFFGLNLAEVRMVLAVDFLAGVGLANYLGKDAPAPPVDPRTGTGTVL